MIRNGSLCSVAFTLAGNKCQGLYHNTVRDRQHSDSHTERDRIPGKHLVAMNVLCARAACYDKVYLNGLWHFTANKGLCSLFTWTLLHADNCQQQYRLRELLQKEQHEPGLCWKDVRPIVCSGDKYVVRLLNREYLSPRLLRYYYNKAWSTEKTK